MLAIKERDKGLKLKLSRRAFFVQPILPLNSLHNFELKYLRKYQKSGW